MSASADRQLFQLYMELGDAQTQRQRPQEAADAYGLALYYARRTGDAFAVQRCRELVLARSPNHVAGQAISAPLFFAQLLMRYPADEAAQALAELRGGGVAAPPLPPAAFNLDIGPSGEPARGGDLGKPPFPGATATNFEAHHVFDLGGPMPAPREDFHLREAGLLEDRAAPRRGARSAALDVLSYLAIAVGVGGGVFFATRLYPTLAGIDFSRALRPLETPTPAAAPAREAPVPKKITPEPPTAPAETVAPPPKPRERVPVDPPAMPPPPRFVEAPSVKNSMPPRLSAANNAPPEPPPVGVFQPKQDTLPPLDPTEQLAKAPKKMIRPVARSGFNQPYSLRNRRTKDVEPPADEPLRVGVKPTDGNGAK